MSDVATIEEQSREVAPAQESASPLIAAIQTAILNPDVDLDRVDRLIAIQREQEDRDNRKLFNIALADAQREILPVVAKVRNTHTSSNYADLAAINAAITPIISKHGFSTSFKTYPATAGDYIGVCLMMGYNGHVEEYRQEFPLDTMGTGGKRNKTDLQGMGSTMTYGRRYLKCLAVDVAVGDDTDGNAPPPPGEFITNLQAAEIRKLLELAGVEETKFCLAYKLPNIESILANNFEAAKAKLNDKIDAITPEESGA